MTETTVSAEKISYAVYDEQFLRLLFVSSSLLSRQNTYDKTGCRKLIKFGTEMFTEWGATTQRHNGQLRVLKNLC